MSGVDQRDVRQRLRKITGLAAGHRVEFFGEQAEIIGDGDDAVEQGLRLFELTRQHIGIGKPEAAGEKRAFDRLFLIGDFAGIVP